MAGNSKDSKILEYKDTISQLNITLTAQTELIKSLQKTLEADCLEKENLRQQIEYLTKKLFGTSSEKRKEVDGQLNLFESVQELAEELFKEQKKITVKSYERSPRKPGVREEMLAGIPKRLKSMLSIHKRIVQSVEEPYGSLGKKSFAQKWNSFQQN